MNGFLLINKPSGLSSYQAVQKIKKIFKVAKVGHLGTLDPLASGLLVLALNRATKFSNYFLESDKHYEVEIELGRSTDTDDSEGNVIFESTLYPKKDKWGRYNETRRWRSWLLAIVHSRINKENWNIQN